MNIWDAYLSSSLRRLVRQGILILRHADGRSEQFGVVGPPRAVVQLRERHVTRMLVLNPNLGLGEAYMNGHLTVEDDNIYGLLEVLLLNLAQQRGAWHERWLQSCRGVARRLSEFNPPARARRNASQHYDLSDTLYDLFLDSDRQYSCAYFTNPGQGLEAAQQAKQQHIAAKLLLKPGHRVLDIGCGWGGLALRLARTSGARVTGITLSERQWQAARDRANNLDPAARPEFLLEDYRRVTGTFDRVVSVGMFEHVGRPHYGRFFETLRARLADDGVALIHTIGRSHGPAATDPWLARHIFPGATIPALSEIMPAIERAGLILTDLEVWRLHYAETLRAWRERFEVNRQAIRAVCGERFCRMWTYYLVASELAFRRGDLVVFQLQLARRQDAVPLTRDYMMRARVRSPEMAETA